MKKSPCSCWIWLAISFCGWSPGFSQTNPEADFKEAALPQTPAGKRLGEFLTAIEKKTYKAFVENEFDPSFFEQMPKEEVVKVTGQIAENNTAFRVYSVTEISEYEVEALLQNVKNGAWRRLSLGTRENPPHKIAGIGIEMADPPAEISGHKNQEWVEKTRRSTYARGQEWVSGDLGKQLDQFMTRQFENGFSGAALVVQKGEKILYKGYGLADRTQEIPNIAATWFCIGSIGKDFTDAAVLKLESQGKLSVEDPLSRFFDDVPADKKAITIHQLLWHSSGLDEYNGDDNETLDYAEGMRRIFAQKLRFEPGTDRQYSNSGFTLLAAIVEKVSGMPFMDYITKEIAGPAGLRDWAFVGQQNRMKEDLVAIAYDDVDLGSFNSPYHRELPGWQILGAGGMVATLDELYRFSQAIKNGKVLPEPAAKKFLEVYNPARATEWSGPMRIFAGGSDVGFTFICMDFPEEDTYVIVASNTGRFRGPKLAEPLAKMLFGKEEPAEPAGRFNPRSALEWGLPDNRVSQRAAQFLNAVCSNEENTIRTFVKDAFHPKLYQSHTEQDHVNFLRSVYGFLQKAPAIADIKVLGDNRIEFYMKSDKTGENLKTFLEVEASEPFRIVGISLGD